MNRLSKEGLLLAFVLLVVMAVFVTGASISGYNVNYSAGIEQEGDSPYSFNFSKNVTLDEGEILSYYDIDDSASFKIYLNGELLSSSDISSWIDMGSSSGILTINSTTDDQTGFLQIPLAVTTSGVAADTYRRSYNFTINATNDAPSFDDIENSYSFSSSELSQYFLLSGVDEESHYPLDFNMTFNSTCIHGSDTGYEDDSNCDLQNFGLSLSSLTDTVANLSFAPNMSHVGTYWANVSIFDSVEDYNCPHSYCDSSYNSTNLRTYYSQMVKFTIYPSLTVDVSNCTDQVLMEDEEFNCTVIITTPGETDDLTLSSSVSFRDGVTSSEYNTSWFALDDYNPSAVNFNYNVSISVTPKKSDVGNLSVNFTVDNGEVSPVLEVINLYVNYTESEVSLDAVDDMDIYENLSFSINAIDEDLFILDSTVKVESLTFDSNTSWVSYEGEVNLAGENYSTAIFNVNYDYILSNNGMGNYSVMLNVSDAVGNTHNQTFVIQILDENAPEWNETLESPVSFNLTEGESFSYNVSKNVSDADGDDVFFYYDNVSNPFCSLNSTNFNSTSGIINFTPTDCDVGYHNVTIIASDGKLNSTAKQFNFTVANVADEPAIAHLHITGNETTIVNGSTRTINEGETTWFFLEVEDYDFLIPSGQRASFYNESLNVSVVITNSTGDYVDLFEFAFAEVGFYDYIMIYNASLLPDGSQADNYTIFLNISDVSGAFVNRTFFLNINDVSDAPTIEPISNKSLTIYENLNFNVYANDEEDDRSQVNNISYGITNLSVGAPNLTIDSDLGVVDFNMSRNSSYAGLWKYNVTVTDSDLNVNFTTFWLHVYGNATLSSPSINSVFNLTENSSEEVLSFAISHSVGDNLTYELWMDSVSCAYQNNSNCNYSDIIFRDITSSFGDGRVYNWSFIPNFTDETYGLYKNLTIRVYPNTTNIDSSQREMVATNFSFKINISHTNYEPVVYNSFGSYAGTYGANSPIPIDLKNSFLDYDYLDSYYLQDVTFFVTSDQEFNSQIYEGGTSSLNRLPWNGMVEDWVLELYSLEELSEFITITANDSYGADTSDPFNVVFTEPSVTTIPTPSSGGGTTTKLKHYSLKLINPQDVIISEKGFIDIPFTVQNNGQIDLRGISLSSFVRFNDAFTDDVKISLGDNYIENLKFGQSENFSMRITANTQRAGKYKATIIANVTSPRFSDFGDFFVEIKKANESEAEQLLIFTDQFISGIPECLELTELLKQAEKAFSLGEYANSIRMAQEVTLACEEAIEANEQIRYKVEGFVQDNFYYISFATLVIFFVGFVFYIYKRVRFNKSGMDEYV
jgi:hypothetical protein